MPASEIVGAGAYLILYLSSTKPAAMRLLLILYVVVFMVLNFFIDHPYIFYLAMTTFPVTVYLLLSKSIAGKKAQQPPQSLSSPKTFSSKSNDRF